jgi:hypothetical protein
MVPKQVTKLLKNNSFIWRITGRKVFKPVPLAISGQLLTTASQPHFSKSSEESPRFRGRGMVVNSKVSKVRSPKSLGPLLVTESREGRITNGNS